MFDWVGGKLKEAIEETISGWIEDIMNWILTMINDLVFKIPKSGFANDVMDFLAWFTSIFAIILVVYKIIEYIINTQNGTQSYPLDEIILRVFKSAGALLVLPWLIKFLIMDIALPIADYFALAGTEFDGNGAYAIMLAALSGGALALTGYGNIVLIIVIAFFVVVFCMFFYSVCVFYADYIIMQILIAPVALSMIADENNFFQVWWREMLSMIVSLLVKVFLVTLVINIIFGGGNILLAIGAGALIIKTPSVLKNMWYAGGGSSGMGRATGNVGSMASRTVLSKIIK